MFCFSYAERYERDLAAVKNHLQQILQSLQLPLDRISNEEIVHFVKNFRGAKHTHIRSLEEEYNPATFDSEEFSMYDRTDTPRAFGLIIVCLTSLQMMRSNTSHQMPLQLPRL